MKNVPEVNVNKTRDDEGNKIINGYKLIKLLAKGGLSKINLLEKNGKKYVMKVIDKNLLKGTQFLRVNKKGKLIINSLLENTMREITVLKKVNHKNILKLYEIIYNNEKNKVYLILEYMENGQLLYYNEEEEIFNINKNFIKENKTIEQSFYSETEIKNIIREISLGLNYLHHQGIIHRDIKPENILFNKDNKCKIIDFNVSAFLPDLNNDNIGKKFEGTDLFRAPETCVLNPKDKDLRGKPLDIWALGITSFLIAYRIFPFKLDKTVTPIELFETIAKSELEFPDENLNIYKKKRKDDNDNKSFFSYLNMYKNNDNENLNNNNINTINDSVNINDSINDEEYTYKSNYNLDYSDLHFSEGFKNFIRGCLEKDPNKRFTIKDILKNKWLNENCIPLTEIQELNKITVNKEEIHNSLGFFITQNFINSYASWAKNRINDDTPNNGVEKYKKALSSKIIPNCDYWSFIEQFKSSIQEEKNFIYNLINDDNKNLSQEKFDNNLNLKNNENIFPKINSFHNKKLISLEYEALKRKDFNIKLKSYNYKLMIAPKNLHSQKKNIISNNSYRIYQINLKKTFSRNKLNTYDVCIPQRISKNLSVLKIRFPEWISLNERKKFIK